MSYQDDPPAPGEPTDGEPFGDRATTSGPGARRDPLEQELEARAAELRALIQATPTPGGPDVVEARPASYLELAARRRRHWLLAAGGALVAAGALLFVLLITGVSILGTLILAPGLLLLALAIGWRPFYGLYLPGLALVGWGGGMIVDKALHSPMYLSLVGLGAGLVLAWIIRRVQAGWAHLWPLVGGVFVGALGVLVGLHSPWSIVWHAWPLLIVAVGVALVVRAVLPARRGAGGPPART
jgi:hypothetical protein